MSRTYAFQDPDLESFRKDVVREVSGNRWLKAVCERVLGRECGEVALVGSVLDPRSFHDSSDVDVAFSLVPRPGEAEGLSEDLSHQLQLELVKTPVASSVLNSLVFVGPIKTKRGKILRIANSSERSVRTAKAEVPLIRQRTQYSCMSASMCACLNALGHKCDEDEVNAVMGARPMKGAAWEQALACAQHYGVRGTLVCPATVAQLREWTNSGKPVMIAWNPEGRDWSHASVVYDVTDILPEELPSECSLMGSRGDPGPWVWVADTNIPNPEKTSRVVPADLFYSKWFEKWPNYLVRRPALMLDREITPEGRQVMASRKNSTYYDTSKERAFARDDRAWERAVRDGEKWVEEEIKWGFRLLILQLMKGYAVEQNDPDLTWFVSKLIKIKNGFYPGIVDKLMKDLPGNHASSLSRKLSELKEFYEANWHSDRFRNHPRPRQEVLDSAPSWMDFYAQKQKEFVPLKERPSPPKIVVDSELSEKFVILDKLIADGFPQAQAAAQAVKDAYGSGSKPSEDQLKALRNMLYRSKMRAEADQFRVASNSSPSPGNVARLYVHSRRASRPGPHWNPWPTRSKSNLEYLLEVFRDYAKEDLFFVMFPDASLEELSSVQRIFSALKRGDASEIHAQAKKLSKGRSSLAEEIRNLPDLWAYVS